MITNTTAKMTYTFTEGITEYAVGFVYQTNPDGSPQIKVYINDAVNTPLVYGTDYTMSQDGTKVVIASGAEVGDSLTIIRNIPIVQLSDYVVGRIDPEQIENDFDLCVERDQQQSARITVTEEQLAAHDERISDIEEVVPESAATDNLLATVSDIPTDLAELTNSPGYITGITSSDVTTALGYTPYDASNPNGYTTNTGTVTSVNNVQPVNGNVTLEFPTAKQSDWAQSDNTKVDYIKNKPTIPTVNNATITITQGGVTKGSFSLNQTSGETIALDAGGSGGGAVDSVNGKTGAVVLTASDVNALPDSTVIPAAQVNSDWNANSGVAQILNKPTLGTMAAENASNYTPTANLATVATSGSYNDLSNKPTIPTVNDSTITITQGGVTKGTFTTNQGSASTIALDAGGTTTGQSIDAEIVGTLTIADNSVVSGFSNNDYLQLPGVFDFGRASNSSFEIGGSFTTSENLGNHIVSGAISIRIYSGSNPKLRVNVNDQNITGTTALSDSTKYYMKVEYDGTDYKIWLSTDGTNYSLDVSTAATSSLSNNSWIRLGQGTAPTIQSIDLADWYIKKNGIMVWQGTDAPGLHQRAEKGHEVIAFQVPKVGNNYTWYRKYADGWVEQGGFSAKNSTVNLPVTMSDTNYVCLITSNDTSRDYYSYGVSATDKTTANFYVKTESTSSAQSGWVVMGIAAN